jgi:hypothetical protein
MVSNEIDYADLSRITENTKIQDDLIGYLNQDDGLEGDIARVAFFGINKTNTVAESVTVRPPWLQNRIAAAFFAYTSFVRLQGGTGVYALTELKNGNLWPVANMFAIWGVPAGLLVGALRNMMHGREAEEIEEMKDWLALLYTVNMNAATLGPIGLVSDSVLWTIKTRQPRLLQMPALQMATDMMIATVQEGFPGVYYATAKNASLLRAITQPSLLDNTTTGCPLSSGRNTRSQEA